MNSNILQMDSQTILLTSIFHQLQCLTDGLGLEASPERACSCPNADELERLLKGLSRDLQALITDQFSRLERRLMGSVEDTVRACMEKSCDGASKEIERREALIQDHANNQPESDGDKTILVPDDEEQVGEEEEGEMEMDEQKEKEREKIDSSRQIKVIKSPVIKAARKGKKSNSNNVNKKNGKKRRLISNDNDQPVVFPVKNLVRSVATVKEQAKQIKNNSFEKASQDNSDLFWFTEE